MEIQMQLEGKILLFFTSSRSTPKRLSHYHLVRPPGGVAAKQSSALSFWFVGKYQSSSPLWRLIQATAAFRRVINSSLRMRRGMA